MRLNLEECLELSPVLEELKFLWLEEPLNQRAEGAIEGYIKINQALSTVKVSFQPAQGRGLQGAARSQERLPGSAAQAGIRS